jgi:beta-glucanase (GH16 family)
MTHESPSSAAQDAVLSQTVSHPIAGHADSLLPKGRAFRLAWADEFDGTTLDESKWAYRLSMMQRRHPAWTDKGVHLDGKGNCVFTLIEEDGRPVSSQLQTGFNFMDEPQKETVFGSDHLQWPVGKLRENKFLHGPGFWECRCRLQQKTGWWSAFWIQSPVIGSSLDSRESGTEIDIMESFKPNYVWPHFIHWGGYGQDHQHAEVGGSYDHEIADSADGDHWHRFGVLWDETGYTFYMDGREDGRIKGKGISLRPEFVLISTEVQGYRSETHQPSDAARAALGDTFLVDYVRVFDEIR